MIRNRFIIIVLTAIFCAVGSSVSAQSDDYEAVVNVLIDEAEEYIGSDPRLLDSISNVIADLAAEQKDDKRLSMAQMYDGISSAMQGDFGPALQSFQEAWKFAIQVSDTHLQVNALTNMAGVYRFANQPENAKDKLTKALKVLVGNQHQQTRANTLLALGIVQEELNDVQGALRSLNEAMHIFEDRNNISSYLSCVEKLGSLLKKDGQFNEALMLYSFALKGRYESEELAMAIPIYREIGNLNAKMNKPDEALKNLSIALNLSDSFNYKLMLDSTLVSLINLSAVMGDASMTSYYTKRLVQYHRDQESKNVEETLASLETEYLLNEQRLENRVLMAEAEQQRLELYNSRIKSFGMTLVIILLFVIAAITFAFMMKIKKFNSQLEEKVAIKTAEVVRHHDKLAETSFRLAHEIRSGAATLLGSKMLLDDKGIPEGMDMELYEAMGASAEKLDVTIKAMIKNLEEYESYDGFMNKPKAPLVPDNHS